ncbi:FAD-dependent monooxygenase [Antarcticirhabdus aurantiaca]|uniref:FAD-dependent monooxygenase n=1 Tax=Antarcticirhabdus aurantiaca TaxID=2606717 RepID=A0ACD4NVG9_9HYPH|nr:FAD-dependent monooxygenase [Antarcticirhabdus aurantiaca]WAJ30753.1 FAD-dependent monooxygenase [Jeongeuplla avenae]
MRPDERPVAVTGAGIAGLTAAIALARFGFAVDIYERAEALAEVGAGLQLSPNALRVLDRLGLLDALSRRAVAARSVTLRRFNSGRPIAEVPVQGSDGTPYLSLHRGALQAVLIEAATAEPRIRLHLGQSLASVSERADGVELAFADGACAQARCLVAADGVRSQVARAAGFADPSPTGTIAWRTTIPVRNGIAAPAGIDAWLGPRRHAVAYPIESGAAVNLVLIDQEVARAEGDPVRHLLRRFSGWDLKLLDWIEAAASPTPWPILSVDAARPYRVGASTLLIGDAAHAMPPYAAQGAALAVEDAFVCAAMLASRPSVEAAFAAFEAERRPRVDAVRRRVAFHRFVYHLPRPASLARDAVLALQPKASLARGLGWLYDWTPPDIAISSPAP